MVSDLHNDFPTAKNFPAVLEKYSGGAHDIVGAVFKGERDYGTCYRIAEEFYKKRTNNLRLAYEDLSYDVSYDKLEKLLDFEPFYVSLTWNGACNLGGGAGSDAPLTVRGKSVIKLLNERGVYVDFAHLCKRAFYEAIDLADKVICSHTAFCGVNEHIRNLDDGQLRALSDRGALVGLCFYPYFLNGTARADVNDVFRHIDYFVSAYGDERLCIGSDFFGCEVYPVGMSDYSFEGVLRKKLYSSGYSIESVEKILFKNLSALV